MARNKKARKARPAHPVSPDAINISSSPPLQEPPQQSELPTPSPDGTQSEPELEDRPAKRAKDTPSAQASAPPQLKEKADKISWDYAMEEMLFQTLVDRARAGKRADQGFKTEAWAEALSKVQAVAPAKIKPLLTVAKLKSKESNYKALYKDWKWLISQSGFGIHPETRVVTASAEAWDEVLQVSKFMSFH